MSSWDQKRDRKKYGMGRAAAVLLLLVALFPSPAPAAPSSPFARLQQRLIRDGFPEAFIKRLYAAPSVRFEARSVLAYYTLREAKLNYGQFLEPESVRQCRAYLRRHRKTLARVERATHVPPRILAALFMVETRLGTYTGRLPVLNVLSSLAVCAEPARTKSLYRRIKPSQRTNYRRFRAFCLRKSKWAYRELKALLQYARASGLPAERIRGSLAGAIGIPQFIPSNVLRFGSDGNGDGKVDLYSHEDALLSAARILRHCGWKKGLTPKQQRTVILCYNRSGPYADTVLKLARRLREPETAKK